MADLLKARLLWIKYRPSYKGRIWFAKFRIANAMFIWLWSLEIGWRMPRLKHVASQLYPNVKEPSDDRS